VVRIANISDNKWRWSEMEKGKSKREILEVQKGEINKNGGN
jgi:hypothetical protein